MTEHPNHRPIHIPLEVSHQMRSPTASCLVPPRLRGTGAPAPPPNSSTNTLRAAPVQGALAVWLFGCLTRGQHPYLEATVCQSAPRSRFVVPLGRRNRVMRWMSQAQMCVAFKALLLVTFLVPARKVTRCRAAPGGLPPRSGYPVRRHPSARVALMRTRSLGSWPRPYRIFPVCPSE